MTAVRVGVPVLDRWLDDSEVTDVGVNGAGGVWIERSGEVSLTGERIRRDEVELVLERIVTPLGLRVDRSQPIVDARLADGCRVHAVVPPASVDGPCLAIRRFAARPVPLDSFCAPAVAATLSSAVADGRSILVSGGTGSGKTTLLNCLASYLPASCRVVTVEDAAELRLTHPHVVRLEARLANSEGVGAVTVRDLVRSALRLRPDRIIVGEVRGGEAFDLLQAMNTGHEGCLSTIHANNPMDALRRLEALALLAESGMPLAAVRAQLDSALDLVVHLDRASGERRVAAVAAVIGGRNRVQEITW
jgi:pilus assembly protein CpaF